MAGLLGKLFGSGDVIKSGIDLIDSFHTSTEEEIAAKTKAKVDIMRCVRAVQASAACHRVLFHWSLS